MIKVDKGHVKIRGILPEILLDTVFLLNGVYTEIVKKQGEEVANEHLVKIVQLAVITDKDENKRQVAKYISAETKKMFADMPKDSSALLGLLLGILKEGDE